MPFASRKVAQELSAASPLPDRIQAVEERLRSALPYPREDKPPAEVSLWLDVLRSAVRDLRTTTRSGAEFSENSKPAGENRGSRTDIYEAARAYLLQDVIPAADMIGLDSEYVRRLLNDYSVWERDTPAGDKQGDTQVDTQGDKRADCHLLLADHIHRATYARGRR